MSNKYYKLNNLSFKYWINSISNALKDKYGDGVEIQLNNNSELDFYCPNVSDKTIRIRSSYFDCGTFSNSSFVLEFSFLYAGDYGETFFNINHLVLGDSFMLFSCSESYKYNALIGKTVGGVSVCSGGVSDSSNSYNKSVTVVDQKPFRFVTFYNSCYSDTGVPYKFPLMLFYNNETGDQLMRKSDGTPDTIDGLYMSLYSENAPLLTNYGLFSSNKIYTQEGKISLYTSILAEF